MQQARFKYPQHGLSRQGGFSLIELAIVIAIGVVLVIAGVTLGGRLMTGANVQGEVQSVGMMVTNVRNLYQRRYANLSNKNALALNLIPPDLVDGDGISGHWGSITLAPAALAGGAANTALQATLANVPPEVCTQLAPQLMGFADELDIEKATVKSQTNPLPARDTVALACGGNKGDNVKIVIRAS